MRRDKESSCFFNHPFSFIWKEISRNSQDQKKNLTKKERKSWQRCSSWELKALQYTKTRPPLASSFPRRLKQRHWRPKNDVPPSPPLISIPSVKARFGEVVMFRSRLSIVGLVSSSSVYFCEGLFWDLFLSILFLFVLLLCIWIHTLFCFSCEVYKNEVRSLTACFAFI